MRPAQHTEASPCPVARRGARPAAARQTAMCPYPTRPARRGALGACPGRTRCPGRGLAASVLRELDRLDTPDAMRETLAELQAMEGTKGNPLSRASYSGNMRLCLGLGGTLLPRSSTSASLVGEGCGSELRLLLGLRHRQRKSGLIDACRVAGDRQEGQPSPRRPCVCSPSRAVRGRNGPVTCGPAGWV